MQKIKAFFSNRDLTWWISLWIILFAVISPVFILPTKTIIVLTSLISIAVVLGLAAVRLLLDRNF